MNQLFIYGTLCPNRENAHILEKIGGSFTKGYVHGTVHVLSWGPDLGLPAIILNEQDPKVEGYFFSTDKLADHWQMLDDFEGFQYQRVKVEGWTESGERMEAWVYAMRELQNPE
ncbi:gamma-glutamylcyclotransferase family protein [Acinetobacter stercoris]|uniref:AIG2-like family protein n=1 Tax=Acinetobacter stercoris TaxID=2126983 RepID=A0A2U3MXT7_9GAMM|nr:gamma-glutamylcyclotransferase family protein [Acinetobacter stercoris]SPL70246.1 AIG2-like family protein [Acinetobacter stercoris]